MSQERRGGEPDVTRIISGLPGAVVLLSSDDFRVKYVNDSYRHFLPKRFQDTDLTGMRLAEFVPEGPNSIVLGILRQVSETGNRAEIKELHRKNEDGNEFWVDWTALAVDNGTDKADLLVTILDITEYKQSLMLSESLNQVNTFINSTLDYNEIMQGVLKEGAAALGAESSLINMREGDHWVARFVYEFEPSIVGQNKADEESPTSMMVFRERKAVAIDDASTDPRVNNLAMKEFGIRSVLVAPIFLRGDVIGVIAFYYHSKGVKFTNAQIDFSSKLTSSLSQAINNARNFQEAKSSEDRVRRQNLVLEGINRIFHESISIESDESLGLVCLDVVEKITQSKFGFIGQMNSKGYLDDDAISDPGWDACKISSPVGHGRLPTSMRVTGLYGRVITSGRGFFSNDPGSHPASTGVPTGHPPLTAFLGVPLRHAGAVIGMIGLGNKEGGYSDEDLRAAEAIAPSIVEALRRKKAEDALKESETRYRSLFENMQEVVTLRQYVQDENGEIVDKVLIDANPAALKVLGAGSIGEVRGMKESDLLGPDTMGGMLDDIRALENGRPLIKETRFGGNGRDYLTTVVPLGKDQVIYTSVDITERKRGELEKEITTEFLRLVNDSVSTRDLIEKATTFFQSQSGVEAVGIRIRDGNDYPYFEARGFPERFIQLENSLCAKDKDGKILFDKNGNPIMECTCGSLIRGIFDPLKPYHTRSGSFWTNSTTELAPTMSADDLPQHHRNRCVTEGYESIALIPLFLGKDRLGLLQLNDHLPGKFSSDKIAQWERLAGYLAVAISKFRTEDELRENYEAARQRAEEVERLMDIIPSAIWVSHDPECRVITGNRAADLFYESDRGENVSAGPASGGEHDTTRRFYREGKELRPDELPMQMAAATGTKVIDSELEVVAPSGKRMTILGSASPLLNSEGKVRGAIAAFVDISERKKQERELEMTKGRLEAIIGQMPVGIIVTESGTGKILFANEEIQKIYGLGFRLTDIKGFSEYGKLARHHLDGRPYQTGEYPFVRSLKGEVIRNEPAEMIKSDGSEVYISSSSAPVYDSKGAIVASVALSIDVSEQVRIQREMDRLLAELEVHSRKLQRSNAELQQFAYVASHDLQEPLRMVTAYLSLIEKRYGDRLDGKAREYMDYAVEGGLRAKDLVRDLLEVSRIDSQAKPMSSTDMNAVMDNVESNLSVQIKEERATVTHDPLPQVMADAAQMTTLMQNLISNGIKFHGGTDPEVHVTCETNDDGWRFAVRDNGIGIDPQFKDKVFVIFQRLHTRDEYEGTGIGLAIAKKIVERHGGRIWFESVPGQGTTFFFNIPRGGKA